MVTKVHPHVCEEHHCLCLLFTPSTVHPHVCRKHIVSTLALTIGSSLRMRETLSPTPNCPLKVWFIPRVWRTPVDLFGDGGKQRSIPACVENTSYHGRSYHDQPVHPRVCGEHGPRLRRFRHNLWSIPACVENTPILGVPILHYYYPMYSRYPAKVGTLPYVKDPCSLHTRDISRFNARVTPQLRAPTPANLPVLISIYTIHTV